jgi:hypothetical protein
MTHPLDRCPRCGSTHFSLPRRQSLSGAVEEVYQRCPKCHLKRRLRLTTESIERERANLARWIAIRNRAGGGRVSSEQVRLQLARLRNAAAREGLAEEVPELCQPNSESH